MIKNKFLISLIIFIVLMAPMSVFAETLVPISYIDNNGNQIQENILLSKFSLSGDGQTYTYSVNSNGQIYTFTYGPANAAGTASFEGKTPYSFESTAYYNINNTSTYSGTWPTRNPNGWSTVAADPSILPIGTRLYIEGYGYAVVEDIGGAIRGNIVDVYFDTYEECAVWGRKYDLKVYILD